MKPEYALYELVISLLEEFPRNESETLPVDVWKSLLFCLLSSQVTAQAAKCVSGRVAAALQPFEDLTESEAKSRVLAALNGPSPRHRFPNRSAIFVVCVWNQFNDVGTSLHDRLRSAPTEFAARDWVVETFCGLGMKQASMFLRDIGHAQDLAVIDSHILKFLRTFFDVPPNVATRSRYLTAEGILRDLSSSWMVDLSTLDAAIWSAVRAMGGFGTCSTSFA